MDKSIVFDTCMQIRHNYDGCKKGMRPSGGRCVPAKGRMAQGSNVGAKVAGGVLGAGALGAAIALPLTLGKKRKGEGKELPGSDRKQLVGKDFIEGDFKKVDEPKLSGSDRKVQKLLPAARKKDSAAQLVFDALSFVLSDRY